MRQLSTSASAEAAGARVALMTDADPTMSSPYSPTTDDRASVPVPHRNPVGVAALIAAGALVVAQIGFQFAVMNAITSGEPLGTNIIIGFVQPAVMGVLAVTTVVLGIIGVVLPGRARLMAGVGLGAGVYALISMLTNILISFGYSLN